MTKILDSFYTPYELARELVESVNKKEVNSIVDFCVGEGRLLQAAEEKWDRAKLYGTDICPRILNTIKKENPNWKLGKCNFLSKNSRNSSPIINQKFDLILSNPPFTCVGSSSYRVVLNKLEFTVSHAMAFIVEAIPYMSNDGLLYAILPESVGFSEKDKAIREYLVKKYNFTVFSEKGSHIFDNCSPNIILVSINNWHSKVKKEKITYSGSIKLKEIIRGSTSMHRVKKLKTGNTYLVHTTNLKQNTIANLEYSTAQKNSLVKGAAVLIPRVGNPTPTKVCVISENETYALSDCIISLRVASEDDAFELQKFILENWTEFASLYKGTGAKFTTLSKLKNYFNLK